MAVLFKKKIQKTRILNPADGFKEIELALETRWDPLTGRSVRILNLPIDKFDLWDMSEMLQKGGPQVCPFCPETLEKVTPQFPPDFLPEGRMRVGEVCLFPNRIPFDKHCAVVIFGQQHYVPLSEFTEESVFNAFLVSNRFISRVIEKDPEVRFFSINWNYLPMAGGSIIHPHLQILAGAYPTYYQKTLVQASTRYKKRWGSVYWEDLIREEKKGKERYVAKIGRTVWLAAFAPLGLTDLMCIFQGRTGLTELTEKDLRDFSRGLINIFRFFLAYNHYSFNLGLYSGRRDGEDAFWVNARITTRRLLPPMGASDVSYFEKIHKESLDYRNPERLCTEVKAFF